MQETEEKKKSTSKKWGIIAVIAAVIVAIIVGISIYNMPENRLQRQIDLGNRYLQEQNYAEAALAFEKAIAIDERCMAAYAGGLEAYLGAGDAENAKTFYDKTLTMLLGVDADYVTANRDSIVELYLSAEKVYADNPEKIAEILEDAYQRAGEDQRLKVKLIETYLGIAKEKTESGAYEDALVIYDRLIELDREDADMIADLSDCLNRYIELLMQEERYDEIRALAEKYGDIATGVDFKAILAKIEAENRAFMQKVYDLMAAQDYEGMCALDESEEAAALARRIAAEHYLYFPSGNGFDSGTGVGIYRYEDEGDKVEENESGSENIYYLYYYGDYASGKRKGNGTQFVNYDLGYSYFTGVWDRDAPNGEGTITYIDDVMKNQTSGRLIDGLWDGEVNYIMTLTSNGETFDFSYSAVKGIPTENKTEEYMAAVPWKEELKEGTYICAYDYHSDTNSVTWQPVEDGESLGIIGFIK